MRITEEDLYTIVDRLNFYVVDRTYHLDCAYGGYSLKYRKPNSNCGGHHDPLHTGFIGVKQLYQIINAYVTALAEVRQNYLQLADKNHRTVTYMLQDRTSNNYRIINSGKTEVSIKSTRRSLVMKVKKELNRTGQKMKLNQLSDGTIELTNKDELIRITKS